MTPRLVPPLPPLPERERFVRGEYVVERWTPADCARYDPSYDDWLALPEATLSELEKGLLGQPKVLCPSCGGSHFGAINSHGYILVYACHDERGIGCRTRFRGVHGVTHDEALDAVEIIFAALFGVGKTFVVGRSSCAS